MLAQQSLHLLKRVCVTENVYVPVRCFLHKRIKGCRWLTSWNSHNCVYPNHNRTHKDFSSNVRSISLWGSVPTTEWSRAVSEAEKIVGYSTSFMSLRFLLSDELANVAVNMKRLVGSKHPLLKTARKLLSRKNGNLQTRGLLVLLIAKAASCDNKPSTSSSTSSPLLSTAIDHTSSPPQSSSSSSSLSHMSKSHGEDLLQDDILNSQRQLAEITEVINTAYLVHKGVINLSDYMTQDVKERDDMEFGNKMATLTGDFLLANVATGLAELENTHVVERMSEAISDMMSAEFTRLTLTESLQQTQPRIPTLEDWKHQTYLSSGSLLSKACASALMLAGASESSITAAHHFGKYLSYAHQIQEELKILTGSSNHNNGCIPLLSAPVTLHLQQQQQQSSDSTSSTATHNNIQQQQHKCTQDHEHLLQLFTEGGQADSSMVLYHLSQGESINESKRLCVSYGTRALQRLQQFETSEAKKSLERIVNVIISSL